MKKLIIFLILISLVLIGVACEKSNKPDGPAIDYSPTQKSGDIAAFSLATPVNDAVFTTIPTFSWDSVENADSYIFEVCTSPEFAFTTHDEENDVYVKQVYIKKTGLMTNRFDLVSNLKKNTKYYWRVTAVNSNRKQVCSDQYASFTYNALDVDEISLSVGYADEWQVHEKGSKATVTADKTDFFRNDKDAIRVTFDKEDTQRGDAYTESNGWVVLSRSLETEFYGVDAFYFNFYYAGNDAAAYFRLIDEDNEYWYAPIKLAMNARQWIIIRFDEFVLRADGSTPVMNMTFDYNYIKTVELVFERADGDGVAYFGDLRAIKYENYKDLFLEEMNFNDYSYVRDNYNFGITVPEDGSSMTYSFSGQANDENDRGIQGYGFIRYSIGKTLARGDAFDFTLSFTNVSNFRSATFILRVVEEDGDRWKFKMRVSDVIGNEHFLLPYAAFALDEFRGDGFRQFGYIKEIQFGIIENYSGGAITVSDFKVVSLADTFEDSLYTVTVEDGLIENFESYHTSIEPYYTWELSAVNKDEFIEYYSDAVFGVRNHSAKFCYKTDLPAAVYHVNFANKLADYTAISISAKDVSVNDADATMIVYLHGSVGELYSYTIESLEDEWTEYVIPISEFALDKDSSGQASITIDRVVGVSFAFQYFYPRKPFQGDPAKYYSGGYVCVDNMRFTDATELDKREVSVKIKPSTADSKITVVSDFDADTADTLRWTTDSTATYATLTLSEATASGGGKCLEMGYKTGMETKYFIDTVFDSTVKANGLTFAIKGDTYGANAVIVLYVNVEGSIYKFQKELTGLSEDWTTYSIGFNSLTKTEGGSFTWDSSKAQNIAQIVINYKKYNVGYHESKILIDDVRLSEHIQLDTFTQAAIA